MNGKKRHESWLFLLALCMGTPSSLRLMAARNSGRCLSLTISGESFQPTKPGNLAHSRQRKLARTGIVTGTTRHGEMNAIIAKFTARAKSIGQMLVLPPLFLLITLIPWLIALGAKLLSDWFYDTGWRLLGGSFWMIAIVLAVAVIVSTAWFFIIWLVHLARVMQGSE